jgi:hypothetical protein
MPSVQNTDICPTCGEEFWYDFDCRTGEYTKISKCKCDREIEYAREFIEKKGLLDEFEKFVAEMEEDNDKDD